MLKKISFFLLRISGINTLYSYCATNRVYIVGYHSVYKGTLDQNLAHVSIEAGLFEEQVKYLKENDHTCIHFSDLTTLKDKKIKKPTIIYFDDGFKDNLTVALPILEKYHMSATVFVVPRYCDESNGEYMNWDEVRDISKRGVEIGSHTTNHQSLTNCTEEEVYHELTTSKERIEKEIGVSVTAFSYPKGRVNRKISEFVKKAGYAHAITTAYGTNTRESIQKEPFLLKKVAPRVYESLKEFAVRLYSFNMLYDFRN